MPAGRSHQIPFLSLSVAAAALLAGCGPEITGVTTDAADPQLGSAIARLSSDNGMSTNGMSQNGMSQNGMSMNGMSQNGFATAAFQSWFNGNPVLSNLVMQYVAKCAAPAGTSYAWKNPTTGVTYTWSGLLGLAPSWASGNPATLVEQQVITACLAAHVNAYGRSVSVSINGRDANNARISQSPTELTDFPQEEGAFFGNIFNGEGVLVCQKHAAFTAAQSSVRACAFDTSVKGLSQICAPMVNTGNCADFCIWKGQDRAWQACNWNGKNYQPISTRIRAQDLYTCGDGVCQVSEHCGTGTTAQSCKADCGVCP